MEGDGSVNLGQAAEVMEMMMIRELPPISRLLVTQSDMDRLNYYVLPFPMTLIFLVAPGQP